MHHALARRQVSGFTLIEISIVLVIIGLLVGGILTGQDLINAAAQSAQVAQITKYNTAVNTFRGKYGYLPGDIPDPYASQFGFPTRGSGEGTGNGNGIISGCNCNGGGGCANGNMEAAGETAMFWVDLSQAGLIDGGFNTATAYTPPGADITGIAIDNYFPAAKIGQGNYVYVWTGGTYTSQWNYSGVNYYGISAVTDIEAASNSGKVNSNPGMSVQQAYNIDKKIDDGYPTTGNVTAVYLSNDPIWADPFHDDTLFGIINWTHYPIAGSATTCFDSGNANAVQQYSLAQNYGNGLNCALSFKFQ